MDEKTDETKSEVTQPETPKTEQVASKKSERGPFHYLTHYGHVWIFLIMLVLALVGMRLVQSQSPQALQFWLALVPIYAGVSVYRSWRRSSKRESAHLPVMARQLLHWVGLAVVIGIVFFLQQQQLMSGEAASISSMLLLALTCFLAGVHFEWTFLVLGAVLITMSALVTYLRENAALIWMIMAIISIGAIAIIFLRGSRETPETDE